MMKKDIDKRLLILVIVLSIVIVSTITFYEVRFRKVLSSYNKNAELYNWVTANAAVERLNRTLMLKDTALTDKKYLEMKYSELAAQNNKLLRDIEVLKSELIIAKSTEEYQKARDGGPVGQFRLIQGKNAEISELKEKIGILCLKLKSYKLSAGEC